MREASKASNMRKSDEREQCESMNNESERRVVARYAVDPVEPVEPACIAVEFLR